MIGLEFRPEARAALAHGRWRNPPPRVQQKLEALWLKSLDLPHAWICRVCRISGNPLQTYLRAYQQGGIERL